MQISAYSFPRSSTNSVANVKGEYCSRTKGEYRTYSKSEPMVRDPCKTLQVV
jgi:hypothetical protein